jgi:putative ABC transport system permease protein
MYRIALKMLIEDRAKYIGMILSLSFSALIITQQAGIFSGIMLRTYGAISDASQVEIWVMNPRVQYIDDIKPSQHTDLQRIRGIDGVEWAVPFFKGQIRAKLSNGKFQSCILIGIDSATLIGAPHTMLAGHVEDLRLPQAVIVNRIGAETKLAIDDHHGKHTPLRVNDVLELNNQRARVVGICEVARTFQSQPVIYTTYRRALGYAPFERRQLSFILIKANKSITPKELCKKITRLTGLAAYTKDEFASLTVTYFLKYTGIPINFGIAVLLGLLVGAAIAGQIFYNFTSDNLKYLALFSMMGASRRLLAKMTLLQALWVALLGWGFGTGAASLLGFATSSTELSFHLSWQLFLGTGAVLLFICIAASLISISRIFKIELAGMFK